jgi:dTDP-4-dehydrorhamnose reductase
VAWDALHDSPSELLDSTRPDAIIHLMALSKADLCEKNPELADRINQEVTCELASLALSREIPFIFTSTDQVFDGRKGCYRESDLVSKTPSVYARTKIDAEKSLQNLFADYPQLLTIFRLALTYGRSKNLYEGPSGWLFRSLAHHQKVKLFTDEYRNPFFIGDFSRIMFDTLIRRVHGLFHIGGPERMSRYEMGIRTAQVLGYPTDLIEPVSIKDFPGSPPRSPDCSFDISSFCATFGWTPSSLEAGLEIMQADCNTGTSPL